MTRNGKIARLPRDIRVELNRRLQDGESGTPLPGWLNALPQVTKVLAKDFGGCLIKQKNLCEWRAGGFTEWQARQEALAQARELAAATAGRLTDHLATVLAARYAAALSGWNGEWTENFHHQLRALLGLTQDIVELRRSDHSGARLNLKRKRLERERERTEAEVVAQFEVWAKNPAVRAWILEDWISPEERRPPDPGNLRPAARADGRSSHLGPRDKPNQTQSNPIKPNQTQSNRIRPEPTKSNRMKALRPGPTGRSTQSAPSAWRMGGRLFVRIQDRLIRISDSQTLPARNKSCWADLGDPISNLNLTTPHARRMVGP